MASGLLSDRTIYKCSWLLGCQGFTTKYPIPERFPGPATAEWLIRISATASTAASKHSREFTWYEA
jgi:hypothetical protein